MLLRSSPGTAVSICTLDVAINISFIRPKFIEAPRSLRINEQDNQLKHHCPYFEHIPI